MQNESQQQQNQNQDGVVSTPDIMKLVSNEVTPATVKVEEAPKLWTPTVAAATTATKPSPTDETPLEFAPTTVKELGNYHFRYLFVGGYGTGKSYALGMFDAIYKAMGGRGLYRFDFDCDNTLRSNGFNTDSKLYIDKNPRQPTAFDQFTRDITEFEEDNKGYNGFAIDSLTLFQAAAMNYVLKINPANHRQIAQANLVFADRNDFGVLVNLLQQFLSQIIRISLKADFFLTTHIREREDETTKKVSFVPAIVGRSLPAQIGGYFSEAWLFRCEYANRIVQTAVNDKVDCKSQIAGMPKECGPEEAVIRAVVASGITTVEKAKEIIANVKKRGIDIANMVKF